MKKMKKWMAVFLTCLMLVPTLAACKREEGSGGQHRKQQCGRQCQYESEGHG